MTETENNTQEAKPKTSKLLIWISIMSVIIFIVIALSVPFKSFLIFAAIFLPVMFFGRLLVEIIFSFRRARKYTTNDEQKDK